MKATLTGVIIYFWFVLMIGNVRGARRTIAQMQLRDSVALSVAQRRTALLVVLWSLLFSGLGVAALWLIW